mgnify:CR=1 FL=1
MNRHYTPEEYYEKCKLLRAAFENPAITTDVIVGFPGETDEEFDKTRQFLEKVHFMRCIFSAIPEEKEQELTRWKIRSQKRQRRSEAVYFRHLSHR